MNIDIDIERLKHDAAYWEDCGAPEDATHFAPAHGINLPIWQKKNDQGEWACHHIEASKWSYCRGLLRPRIERPTTPTWNGEGLPPIGTVCNILGAPDGSWSTGVIDYIDWVRCVWHWQSRPEMSLHNLVCEMKFRPLKSSRERWCEQANKIEGVSFDAACSIYDAMQSSTLSIPERNDKE